MKRAWIFLGVVAGSPFLHSNPSQCTVMAGNVALDLAGKELRIQADDRSILHWQDFSIDFNEVTKFILPNDQAYVLNRVLGNNVSQIMGSLLSNGQVIVVNPQGIYIGNDAVVDTAGFIASTLDLRNEDFCKGTDFNFIGESENAVVNFGTVRAWNGDALLIGYQVKNEGSMNAPQGVAGLAAGMDVMIRPMAQEHIFIKTRVKDTKADTGIEQNGIIEGLQAEIKADGNLYQYAVKFNGKVNANRMVEENGRVFLVSDGGNIDFKGEILADSGTVTIDGERVFLDNGSHIDVSGDSGGGAVWIDASEWVGAETDARIEADARVDGNGGEVVVFSPGFAGYRGTMTALGGAEGGNGGFLELSGKRSIDMNGIRASSMAPKGNTGRFLLDPCDINITTAGPNNNIQPLNLIPPPNPPWTASPDVTPTANPGTVKISDIIATLNTNGFTIETDVACAGGGTGAITISGPMDWSGNANTHDFNLTATGTITISVGSAIKTNGGLFITAQSNGSSIVIGSPITVTHGDLVVDHDGAAGGGAIIVNLGSPITADGVLDGIVFETNLGSGVTCTVNSNLTTTGPGSIEVTASGNVSVNAVLNSSNNVFLYSESMVSTTAIGTIMAAGNVGIGEVSGPPLTVPTITIQGPMTAGGTITTVGSTGTTTIAGALTASSATIPAIYIVTAASGAIVVDNPINSMGSGGVTLQTLGGGNITNNSTIDAALGGSVFFNTQMTGDILNAGAIGTTACGDFTMTAGGGGLVTNTAQVTTTGFGITFETDSFGDISNTHSLNAMNASGDLSMTTNGTGNISTSVAANSLLVGGNATFKSKGTITHDGVLSVTGTGTTSFDSSGGSGDILINGNSVSLTGGQTFHSNSGSITVSNSPTGTISTTSGPITMNSDLGPISINGGLVFSSLTGTVSFTASKNITVDATAQNAEVFVPTGTINMTSQKGNIIVEGFSNNLAIIGRDNSNSAVIIAPVNPNITFNINAPLGSIFVEGASSGSDSYGMIGIRGTSLAAAGISTLSASLNLTAGDRIEVIGGQGTNSFGAIGIIPNLVDNTTVALEVFVNTGSSAANVFVTGGGGTNAFALVGGGGFPVSSNVTFSPYTVGSSNIDIFVGNISSVLQVIGGNGTNSAATIGFITPGLTNNVTFTQPAAILVGGLTNGPTGGSWTVEGGTGSGSDGLIGLDLSVNAKTPTTSTVTAPAAQVIGLLPYRTGLSLIGTPIGAGKVGVFSNALLANSPSLGAAIGIDAFDPATNNTGTVSMNGNTVIQDYYAGSFPLVAIGIGSQRNTTITSNANGQAKIIAGDLEILAGQNLSITGGSSVSSTGLLVLAVDFVFAFPHIGPGRFTLDSSSTIATNSANPARVYTARFVQNTIQGTLNGVGFTGTQFTNDSENQYGVFLMDIFFPFTGTASFPYTIFYKESTSQIPIGNPSTQTLFASEFNTFPLTYPFSGSQAEDIYWDNPYWINYNRASVDKFVWRKGTVSSYQQNKDDDYFIFRKKYLYYRGY